MRRLLSMADVAVLIGPVRTRHLGLHSFGRVRLERFLRRRMWRLRLADLERSQAVQFEPVAVLNDR